MEETDETNLEEGGNVEETDKTNLQEVNAELRLWGFYPEAGMDLPFWHPNGALIRNAIEDLWRREHLKQGYDLVYTPHIANATLWDTSGHNALFSKDMYPRIVVKEGKEEYILRPMNCPFHIILFKSDQRSFRDLPIRYAELGTVYRKIPSGSGKGMFEVRGFTQDDAHIFCERHNAKEEIANLLQFTNFFLRDVFGITNYRIIRRLKSSKAIGEDGLWANAQKLLKDVLDEKNLEFEDKPGEAVFYGPKIDFEIADPSTGRSWICSTIQLDIVLAEKFGAKYVGKDGSDQVPLIIHRTILGSLERFVALLISRTKGHLPLWLSPCQVRLVPIGGTEFELNLAYANSVKPILENKIADLNPRISIDGKDRDIRDARKEAIKNKTPYIVVIGGHERVSEKLSVSCYDGATYPSEARTMSLDELARELRDKIQNRD